jgi:methylenetetrahydrofolate reductase (NADPH)
MTNNISDIWNDTEKGPTLSFELSPPKNEKAAENLEKTITEFCALKPDFFSVTFGAGGSTREGSHALVDKLKREHDQEVVAYLAPFGMGPMDISSVLDGYRDLGITNILAIRGDEPRDIEEFKPHPDSFSYSSELIAFIKDKYDFSIGAAGYPEGHTEAKSLEHDLEVLKAKVDNGAEFVICQYFYDNQYFFDFQERARAAGIDVPLVPGIMPIFSVKMMEILAGVCGATITEEVRSSIAQLPGDDKEALQAWGVDFAVKQCRGLLEAGTPGLHFYTLNKRSFSMRIVEELRSMGLL